MQMHAVHAIELDTDCAVCLGAVYEMVLKCSFSGCLNSMKKTEKHLSELPMSKDERLTFHMFPLHNPEQLKIWLLSIWRDVDLPIQYIKRFTMQYCN